jgi:TP901 family phage tail tape measure protein
MDYNLQIKLSAINAATPQINAAKSSVDGLANATKTASTQSDNFGKSLQSLGSRVNVLGQRMTGMLTLPLLLFANQAINTAVEIETAWVRFSKVFNGTTEEMKQLQKVATEMSNKFGKPVEEISEIMAEFNKVGINSVTELTKLADITAQTAILFDTDMKTALNGTKAVMMGFNLTADETQKALAAINMIGDKTAASEAGILTMFQKAGASARVAGLSIIELAAAEGAFEASNISASVAGNAMNSILTAMVRNSKVVKEQFSSFGIDMGSFGESLGTSGTVTAKTSAKVKEYGDKLKIAQQRVKELDKKHGTAKSTMMAAKNTVENLKEKIDGATKSTKEFSGATGESEFRNAKGGEQLEILAKKYQEVVSSGSASRFADMKEMFSNLVGKTQINKFLTLMQDMAKEFDNNDQTISQYYLGLRVASNETENLKFANEQLAKVMDSGPQKLERLNQMYRNQQAIIGNELLPVKMALLKAAEKLLGKFNSLSDGTKKWILIALGIVTVAGPILMVIGLFTTLIGFIGSVSSALGITGLLSSITGIGSAAAGVTATGAALPLLLGAGGIIAGFVGIWALVKPKYDELQTAVKGAGDAAKDSDKKMAEFQKKIDEMEVGPLKDKLQQAIDQQKELSKQTQVSIDRYAGLIGIWNAMNDITFQPLIKSFMDMFNYLTKEYNENRGRWEAFRMFWQGIWDSIIGILEIAVGILATAFYAFCALFTGQWDLVKVAWDIVVDGMQKTFKGFTEVIGGLFGTLFGNIGNGLNDLIDKFNNLPSWLRGGQTINFKFDIPKDKLDQLKNSKGSTDVKRGNMANNGGIIYAANGFLSKGRDTVPAMLSPGEMVLNKSQQSTMFDMLSGKSQLQTAGGVNVSINVGNMIASRGEQREFARRIEELLNEDKQRY